MRPRISIYSIAWRIRFQPLKEPPASWFDPFVIHYSTICAQIRFSKIALRPFFMEQKNADTHKNKMTEPHQFQVRFLYEVFFRSSTCRSLATTLGTTLLSRFCAFVSAEYFVPMKNGLWVGNRSRGVWTNGGMDRRYWPIRREVPLGAISCSGGSGCPRRVQKSAPVSSRLVSIGESYSIGFFCYLEDNQSVTSNFLAVRLPRSYILRPLHEP